MKRALYALASLALGLIIVYGCQNGGLGPTAQITVQGAEVREWTDPDDGRVYLVVAPTWKNEGPGAVRDVALVASLKGPSGAYPTDEEFKALSESLPKSVLPFVWYHGDPVDGGSTIHPSDASDTFAVLGLKEDVLKRTGPNPGAKVEVVWARADAPASEPPTDVPPPQL